MKFKTNSSRLPLNNLKVMKNGLQLFERYWFYLACAFVIIFPLLLLADIDKGYYYDWYNHTWLIGYYGEYFSTYHSMPEFLNTNQVLLVAYPTFYGHLLYVILGWLSSFAGANIALRIGILILWIVKFVLVYRVIFELAKDRSLSFTVATLVVWEIYPLTNLYSRGAVTELFGTSLLVIAFCAELLALHSLHKHEKVGFHLVAGFSAALAGASHPITAVFGYIFLGLFFGILVLDRWVFRNSINKTDLTSVVVLLVFVACVLSPWAYATISFKGELVVDLGIDTIRYFPEHLDYLLVRFSPFPFDIRSLYDGQAAELGTPYLDAQINIPLLFMVLFILLMKEKKAGIQSGLGIGVLIASIIIFLFFTSLSISPYLYQYIPVFNVTQSLYRLITYQNISILAVLASLFLAYREVIFSLNSKLILLTLCITLAGNNVLIKFWHAQVSSSVVPQEFRYDAVPDDKKNLLNLPGYFYGLGAYTFISGHPIEDDQVNLPTVQVNLGFQDAGFGRIRRQSVYLSERTWVLTNVAYSPWNEVLIDGVPAKIVNDVNQDRMLDVLVPAGEHNILARFSPDPIYMTLRKISYWAFALWTLGMLLWYCFVFIRYIKSNGKANPERVGLIEMER